MFAKKKGLSKKAGPPVHDDLVGRDFSAARANELWLTDITEHRTDEGKLYLCAIKDCFSNRIVGYSMKDRMTSSLAVAALRNAIGLRCPVGTTIIHSDRGSQGEFKRSSQHLDHGGARWGPCGSGSERFSSIGVRSLHQGGRRSHGVRIESGSGRPSLAV